MLYLQRFGTLVERDACLYLGISRRTYYRCLADLRQAGVYIDGEINLKGQTWVAFDERLAPIVRVA
jgi:predicted DNA-binding transcriptional regulator YafY